MRAQDFTPDTGKTGVRMFARHTLLALLLLLALASGASAQGTQPPDVPPLQPGPGPTSPDAAEDDEELGEEIPGGEDEETGDEGDPPSDPGGSTGGSSGGDSPERRSDRVTRAEPRPARLPRTGGETIPLVIAGMATLGGGLLLWSAVPARSRP